MTSLSRCNAGIRVIAFLDRKSGRFFSQANLSVDYDNSIRIFTCKFIMLSINQRTQCVKVKILLQK